MLILPRPPIPRTCSLTHKLSSTATFSALEHGAEASGALKFASSAPKGGNSWAHHATPSLSSYIARRLAFTRRASLNYTGACVALPMLEGAYFRLWADFVHTRD